MELNIMFQQMTMKLKKDLDKWEIGNVYHLKNYLVKEKKKAMK